MHSCYHNRRFKCNLFATMEPKSKFRTWLYDNGLLLKDFCLLIGVDKSQLWRWMKGKFHPGTRAMKRIKICTKGAFVKPEDLYDKVRPGKNGNKPGLLPSED